MSFYLRKEWIDQVDGIEQVFIHYAVAPRFSTPDWSKGLQSRELAPEAGTNRKRRSKVIKLPRQLEGSENYHLGYFFEVRGRRNWITETFVEEIISDGSYTFIDYTGDYTNICIYWSINGWGAYNYSTMFEDGTDLNHPLSSLHFYGRAYDGIYTVDRFNRLKEIPLPHVYRGKVHGPRGSRVDLCFHIMRRGSPDGGDYDFWDNNEGLNYFKELQ
jgi:hypothetical protein